MNRRAARDRGFTLTELLVVITLTGIIGAIVTAAVTTGLSKQTQVQDRGDALAQARTALQRVDRDIRSSNPLEVAQSNEIRVCEVQSTGTRQMTYTVDADGSSYDLNVAEVDVPNCSTLPVPATTPSPLIKNLVNTSATPVFSFTKTLLPYTAPSAVDSSSCAIAGTSPVAYDTKCVGTVTVHLLVQPSTLKAPVDLSDNGTNLRNPG